MLCLTMWVDDRTPDLKTVMEGDRGGAGMHFHFPFAFGSQAFIDCMDGRR